jgi:ankyrin repeat protein
MVQSPDSQLRAAWAASDEDAIVRALHNGADPDCRADGVTLLIAACQAGKLNLVRELLNAGASVDAPSSERNETALMFVVAVGYKRVHEEIRDLLIAGGADVNARDIEGNTALDWAIASEKLADAEMLLAHHATCRAALRIRLERLRDSQQGGDRGPAS